MPTLGDRAAAYLGTLWERLRSEFAVHGLAYLGVFLVFVAILGFVIFAFAGVQAGVRPVAEALIPAFLFGASVFLRRREAPFVANALLLLGGAITPVVLFAAFVDGAPFPPDLEDAALVLTLTAISVILAGIYAFVGVRNPRSPIRYLAAPMLWVGAGVIGFAFDEKASAAQTALVCGVIVLTAGLAVWFRDHPLARPTRAVTMPALVIAYAFTLVFASQADWPAIPALAAGAAVLATTEILPRRFGLPWAAQGAVMALTAATVSPEWGAGPVAVAVVAGYLGLAELWVRRDPAPAALPVFLAAAGIAVAVSAADAETLLAASLIGAVWCHTRHVIRLSPALVIPVAAGAVALPVAGFAALFLLTSVEIALTVAGGVLAAGAAAARIWRPGDALYRYAIPAAAAAVVLATIAPAAADGVSRSELGLLSAAGLAGALALAVALPLRGLRVWASGAAGTWALLLLLRAVEVTPDWRAASIGITGVALIAASVAWGSREGGHLALLGHGLGGAALFVVTSDATLLTALLAWTAGWIVETAATEANRAPYTDLLLSRIPDQSRFRALLLAIAPTVAMVSIPFALVEIGEQTGLLEGERGRMGLMLASTAVVYGLLARWAHTRRPLGSLLAGGGVILAGIAIAIAAPEPWPTITAVGSTVAVVAVIGGDLRRPIMTWFAWAVSPIMAILLAAELGLPARHLDLVLGGWGALLLIGGLGVDEMLAGRRRGGQGVRTPWLIPPVALAAVEIPAALAFRIGGEVDAAWPVVMVAGGLYFLVALQLRAGAVSAAGYGLAALGAGMLLTRSGTVPPLEEPWVLSAATAGLIALSAVLRLVTSERDPWLGWDIAPLAVAHALAAVALVAGAAAGKIAPAWGGLAALSLLVAAWKRRWAWVGAAGALVLVAILVDPIEMWPWTLGIGALVFPAAARLRTGALSLAGYTLFVYGGAAALYDTGYWPQDLPWLYVPAAALLLAISFVLERFTRDRHPITGWDVAPLVGAHGVAVLALITTAVAGYIPATWTGFAALALLIVVWKGHWAWVAPGGALVLVAILVDPIEMWPWALGIGALFLPAAARLRTGALSLAAYALFTYGGSAAFYDTSYWPQDRPWLYVPWAAVLVAVSFLLTKATRDRHPITGWDLAPLVGAHGVAVLALITTAVAGHIPATWIGFAALALLIAAWKRHWAWIDAAMVLALVGAADAGLGWLALGLAASAVVCLAIAAFTADLIRVGHQVLAPALAGWAWVEWILWADWPQTAARAATAWVAGGLVLVLAVLLRRRWLAAEWALPWAGLSAVMLAGAALATGGSRLEVGLALAGGLALWSLASALAAAPLGADWLREAAAIFALGAGGTLGYATEPTPGERVAGSLLSGAAATITAVVMWARNSKSPWVRPLVLYASVAHLAAIGVGLAQLPERPLLVAALAAAGIEAVALGIILRAPGFLYAGHPLLLGAWITFASEALSGEAQWYTIPIGLTILGLVETARWDLRRRDLDPAREEVVAAEFLGVAFLVGAGLIRTVVSSPAFGLIGIGFGILVVGWGAVTWVRRRVFTGAGVVVLSGFLMVAVPLAKVIPQFRGIALWATLGAIGTVLIVIAVNLERGRAMVRAGVRRLQELMEGWE